MGDHSFVNQRLNSFVRELERLIVGFVGKEDERRIVWKHKFVLGNPGINRCWNRLLFGTHEIVGIWIFFGCGLIFIEVVFFFERKKKYSTLKSILR